MFCIFNIDGRFVDIFLFYYTITKFSRMRSNNWIYIWLAGKKSLITWYIIKYDYVNSYHSNVRIISKACLTQNWKFLEKYLRKKTLTRMLDDLPLALRFNIYLKLTHSILFINLNTNHKFLYSLHFHWAKEDLT